MSPYERAVTEMARLAPVEQSVVIIGGGLRRRAQIRRRMSQEEALASASAWWLLAHEIDARFLYLPIGGSEAEVAIVYDGREVQPCAA